MKTTNILREKISDMLFNFSEYTHPAVDEVGICSVSIDNEFGDEDIIELDEFDLSLITKDNIEFVKNCIKNMVLIDEVVWKDLYDTKRIYKYHIDFKNNSLSATTESNDNFDIENRDDSDTVISMKSNNGEDILYLVFTKSCTREEREKFRELLLEIIQLVEKEQ